MVCNLKYGAQQTKFSVILDCFLPFYPLMDQENQKTPEDIIILHMFTINDNHVIMVPEMWSATDRIFCHCGPFFAILPR